MEGKRVKRFPSEKDMGKNLKKLLRLLEGVRSCPDGSYMALCPAHDDHSPSLHITPVDGKILLHCFAGCQTKDVLERLGLTWCDISPHYSGQDGIGKRGRLKKDLAGPDDASQTIYRIYDPSGTILLAEHIRWDLPNGGKTFLWKGRKNQKVDPKRLPLYKVWDLKGGEGVVITEGEKACDALWAAGIAAVGTYGAHVTPDDQVLKGLLDKGPSRIILWPDADEAGRRHMSEIAKRLLNMDYHEISVVRWEEAPPKGDAYDALEILQPEGVRGLIDQAVPYLDPEAYRVITIPERLWLIEDIIPDRGIILLAGSPKSGKSNFSLNVGRSLVFGEPFLDKPANKGKVLYLALERYELIQERSSSLGLKDISNFLVLPPYLETPLKTTHSLNEKELPILKGMIRRVGPKLIIIDPLILFLDLSPDDFHRYDRLYPRFGELRKICEDFNCAIMLVHHTRKSASVRPSNKKEMTDEILGSRAIAAISDVLICVSKKGQGYQAEIRSNFRKPEVFKYDFAEDLQIFLTDEEEEFRTKQEAAACYILDAVETFGQRKRSELISLIGDRLGISQDSAETLVKRGIRKLREEGKIKHVKHGVYAPAKNTPKEALL